MLASEVKQIEMSTPFIKDGKLLDASNQEDRKLCELTLADIEFIKTSNSVLGKGSYGEVELARIKGTGK